MARCIGSLVGSKDFVVDYFASAAITAGQLLVAEPTTTQVGEVHNPVGTGSGGATDIVDAVGVATDSATSNTSPTREPSALLVVAAGGLENMVRIEGNPFAIIEFKIAGGATSGTALATTSPANILTNSTADASAPYATISSTAVGTIDMIGGLLKGRTGNNVGSMRKLTGHSNNTSCTVGIGFTASIGVNDTYIRVPYARGCTDAQMTTDFTEMNGIITCNNAGAYAALGNFRVLNVIINENLDTAYVHVIIPDHYFNPESA